MLKMGNTESWLSLEKTVVIERVSNKYEKI